MDVKLKLKEVDQQRVLHLAKLVNSKSYHQDIKHYLRFVNLTHHSLKYLQELAKIKTSVHHSCIISKKVKQILFIRENEISLLRKIVKQEGIFGKLLVNDFLRNLTELVLKRYVHLEVNYAQVVIKVAESNVHEAEELHRLISWEERKRYAYLLISGFFWLIPFLGTLLFILSSIVLNIFNELTPNYKRLMKKLE